MKKKHFVIVELIAVFLIGLAFLTISQTRADSGWDTSYDSSSSWSSSDSWSSSSDWGSSYSSDYDSYSSGDGSTSPIEVFVILALYIALIIYFIIVGTRKKHMEPIKLDSTHSKSEIVPIDPTVVKERLDKYGINEEDFCKMAYEKYVTIQEAWMNFDYEVLKNNVSDELYNTYHMQLDALKVKKEKNIMRDFVFKNAEIRNITDDNGVLNIAVFLNVEMYDYVVNSKNVVVRGTDQKKVNIRYMITFIKKIEGNTVTKCPNCGAEVEAIVSSTCSYCHTRIVENPNDFVMSKKTNIGQRLV